MKRLLITGATSGIGYQLAMDYATAGWQVTACGRNVATLEAMDRLERIETVCFDITDHSHVRQASETITHTFDLVILNAGTCEYIDDPIAFNADVFKRVFDINVLGVGYCLEAFTKKIKAGGQLAFMGSSASFLPFSRAEAYGSSKAAIRYLAESIAIDVADYDIAVSLISPGFVDTPLTHKNNFPMPMMISMDEAAKQIKKGLDKRKKHVLTSKALTLFLRVLGKLPHGLRHQLGQRLKNK